LKKGKSKVGSKKNRTGDIVFVFFLFLLVLFFFRKIFFTGKVLYGHDFILQFYAWKDFVYEHLRSQGSLPFWNPYLFCGTPFITNIQVSMFYPLGFLYYLLPPELAYGYATIFHCILGSIFMYAFMRTLSVSQVGCFVSALVFTFNGYFMAHLYAGHLSFVQTYIWIPLIFLFLYKFTQKRCFKYAVMAGLILGVQILGGFPQIAFYAILSSMALAFYHGIGLVRDKRFNDVFQLGVGLTIILIVAFTLAAVQVLPTMEFTRLSTRAGSVSYAFATYDSLHPKQLLAFLLPDIFGNVLDKSYWLSKNSWHFWETCGYVGLLPLFLIFIKVRSQPIRSLWIFFIIIILVSVFLALGKYNPIYPIVYRLPGFNSFRIPAQIIFLYVFGISVVAGMGTDRILDDRWQFSRGFVFFSLFTGILFLLLMVGLAFFPYQLFFSLFKHFAEGSVTHANLTRLYERFSLSFESGTLLFFGSLLILTLRRRLKLGVGTLSILVPAIVVMDLYLFGTGFIRTFESGKFRENQDIAGQLKSNPVQGRVTSIGSQFLTNDGLKYGFPSILGYDPLILKRYVNYTLASQGYAQDDKVVNLRYIDTPGAKLIRMLNVRRLVSGGRVTNIHNEFPYATIVGKAVIKPLEEVIPFMKSDKFDPRKMVVFEPEYSPNLFPQGKSGPFKGSCIVLDYDNESIRIKTSSGQRGYLVLSEIFYPGWQAKVNGKGTPILRGNYLFRVIPLDRGEHEVHLYFISWPFRIGAILSLMTLTLSLMYIARRKKASLA